ncbi:MAG TPA: alpha/beta hydrolase [Streptosporangiaceae bacterium]|jgi:3-oxoadipate enol-lactonase
MELTVPADGGEIWADDTGGPGTPIVLLHPGWGDSSIWLPLMSRLPRGYRVIRYDVQGFGRSPAPHAPFTHLGNLTAVLDHLDVPRAALVGHSGGGGTAIGLALTSPPKVSALILLAPGVQDYPWSQDDPYVAEFGKLAAADDRAGLAALGLGTWAAADTGPDAQAQITGAVAAMFQLGGFEQPDPPAYDRLHEITAPAVVALGDLEYPMVARCANSIADRIPGCRLVPVPGADHMLPLRAPDLIADLIREYTP